MTTHRAVEKCLDILMAFSPHNQEMGTVEMSLKMDINKSTTSRLLHVLERKGFLRQNLKTKKFQLGPSAMNLGIAIKRSLETNLVHLAKPHMDELRNELKETIALEVFSGNNTVLAYLAKGPHRISLAGNVGDILAVHAAAGAKVILAFSSSRVRERILNGKLARLTPNTITDPEHLKKQLQEILKNGFSFDREEHDIGTCAMGVPVFNSEGKPCAALVVIGPSQRINLLNDSRVVTLLKETASKISEGLYHEVFLQGNNDTNQIY